MLDRSVTRAWFSLSGAELAPQGDRAWESAPASERVAYWNEVARIAFEAKRRELLRAIDVQGNRLPPRKAPRADGAKGPVLDPHHSDSRFLTKLRYKGFPDRAEVWWAKDWAIVVEGQARRGRDVCGLTADSQMKVAAQARKWWANREQRGVNLGPLGRATVMGGPLPPGAVAITPAYRLGAAPPRVATPTLAGPLPAWTVAQRLNRVYQAAGEGRTTERQIRETMAALGPVADGVLRDVAMRFGIADAGDRAGVLRLLERQLRDRLAEANRLKRPTPPKAPTPPLPPAPIPPATPMRIPAPLPFAPILPGVFADAPIPAEIAAALPEALRGAQVLSDLARTRAGRVWWQAVGRALWDGLQRRAG